MALYELTQNGVRNTTTRQHIPNNPMNRHWKEYQLWLGEGNTPDPEPPVVKPTIDEEYNGQSPWLRELVKLAGVDETILKTAVNAGRPAAVITRS